MGRFDNWYKRRINRIYPTVFAWAILGSLLFGYHNDINNILLSGGGWFVSCIMLYYVLLYFIHFFMFMLMGAMMGIAQRKYRYHFVWDGLKLTGCVVVFYALYAFKDMDYDWKAVFKVL